MTAPSISTRMREWTVVRRPVSLRRMKVYGKGEAPVWYGACDPEGKCHEVCVRANHAFCLHHGNECHAIAAVLSRLMAREMTLLPSRQEIEDTPKGKHVTVSYCITDAGKEELNEAPELWCYWCDEALDERESVATSYGSIVHSRCLSEAELDLGN